MRKFIFFALFTSLFAFDIDDFDRGMHALHNENFKEAYEIFYQGCESDDSLSCEELGMLYVNGSVLPELDARADHVKIGLGYLLKSCMELDYLNACGDLISMKDFNETKEFLNDDIIKHISAKYDELAREFDGDLNATNPR